MMFGNSTNTKLSIIEKNKNCSAKILYPAAEYQKNSAVLQFSAFICVKKINLRDENGLILSADHHALESALSNGKNMRGHLIPPLTHVDLHGTLSVDGESLF